jgi:hypothetical protein
LINILTLSPAHVVLCEGDMVMNIFLWKSSANLSKEEHSILTNTHAMVLW